MKRRQSRVKMLPVVLRYYENFYFAVEGAVLYGDVSA
jgi:hypothetical protein